MATKLDLVFNALTDKAQAAVGALLSNVNQGIARITANNQAATASAQRFGNASAAGMQQAGSATAQLNNRLAQMVEYLKQGIGIDLGAKLVQAIQSIPDILKRSTERGIEFNQTLEDARLGIAAILKQFNPEEFATFNDALKAADAALDLLAKKATQSPATLKELVTTFQAITGAATSANIPLDKQVNLVVLLSQALAGLSIRSDQLIQESRALLTGNINQNALAAKTLEITKEQVDAAKEQGTLYEFLTTRLSAFMEAGERGAANYTTRVSNLSDVLDQVFGRLTVEIFDTLKRKVGELTDAVAGPEFQEGLRGVAKGIERIIRLFSDMAILGVRHIREIQLALETLSAILLVVAARTVAVKFAAMFGGIASITELITAFSLLAEHIVAVIAAAGGLLRLAGWIGVVITALHTAIAGWKAWKAAQDEALSKANLPDANQQLATMLLKIVQERVQLGQLQQKQAADIKALIEDTLAHADEYGPDLVNDILRGQARELQIGGKAGPKAARNLTQEEIDGQRELALAKANAALEVKRAELDKEHDLVEQAYKENLLQLEGYLARRRQLVTESYNAELKLLDLQAFQITTQMHGETDPAKKLKLAAELEEVNSQRKQLAIKFERDLTDITRDGEEKRHELRQKAVKDSQELLQKINEDFRQSNFTKRQLLEDDYNRQKALIERTIKDEEEKAIALLLLYKTYTANKAKLEAEEEIRRAEKEQKVQSDLLAIERARVQNSYLLTDNQKRKKEIELLEQEEKALNGIVDAMQEKARLARASGNEAAAATYEGQADQYAERARSLAQQRAGMQSQPDPDNLLQNLKAVVTEFQNQMGTVAQQIASVFRDVIGSAVDSIAQGISGLIMGTMTWGQALENIGTNILNSIVNGLARMVAQWIVNQILMWTIGKSLQSAAVAASIGPAAASTAIWSAPATLATIATFGGAAAAAPGFLAAANATSLAVNTSFAGAAAAGGGVGSGFKSGGYTGDGDPNQVAGVVHKGEYVIPAPLVRMFGLDRLASAFGALDGISPRGFSSRANSPAINIRNQPNVNVSPAPVQVALLDRPEKIAAYMKSTAGQAIIVDAIKGNKLQLGISS